MAYGSISHPRACRAAAVFALVLAMLLLAAPASRADGAPSVSGVIPEYGPLTGGTEVTVSGSNFMGASTVWFVLGEQYVAATPFNVTDGSLDVYSPPGLAAGPVDVEVTANGTSAPNPDDQFTYDTIPTVTTMTPSAGPIGGGNPVTITGTGFGIASCVSFGPPVADRVCLGTGLTIESDNQLVVTAPDVGTVETVDVTVITGVGTSSAGEYTFAPPPSVTSVGPNVGPEGGGTTVTISGSGFTGVTGVMFGSTPAASYAFNSDSSITATSPADADAGPVHVTVTTLGGGSSAAVSADQFTYLSPPAVTGISPSAGPAGGGGTITITGTNLAGATAVDFGSTASPVITADSSDSVTAVIPGAASASTVPVTVTTLGGTSPTSPGDDYTYVGSASSKTTVRPAVTSIGPVAGSVNGGTRVTIDGTNLGGVSAVDFGTVAAASFAVESDSQIVAVAPAHVADAVTVWVTAGSEQSLAGAKTTFTYAPMPTVLTVHVAGIRTVRSVLKATINDGGIPVTGCVVQYGRTKRYGVTASCPPLTSPGSIVSITASLARLAPATVYHYRLEVTTAAGTVVSEDKWFTTLQLPLLKAPSVGLVVQRSLGTRGTIGQLLGIDGIEHGVAGESIVLRCLAGCSQENVLTLKHLEPPLNRIKATLAPALPLSIATRIEVGVSKAGHLGRFAVYAFVPAGSTLAVQLVKTGCLSTRGRTVSCRG